MAINHVVMKRLRAIMRVPAAGAALFLLLLGCYLLTMSGHTYSSDEETMLAAGDRLITYGSFAIPSGDLMNRAHGIDQHSYSRYGPGQSLAAIPFILAGKAVGLVALGVYKLFLVRLFVLILPALATATTGVLLYAWVRQIGYSKRIGLLVGLLYGFTSLAWPYSRTFFAEPMSTLFLVLCGYAICRTERRWWAIAGAAAACALAVKFQTLLALPFLAGYAALLSWHDDGRSSAQVLAERVVMGLFGAALPLGLLFLYNTRLFGGPLNSGYGGISVSGLLNMSNESGLYGLTISTGKGLLFFSPTIVLGLLGLFFRWRQQWRESLLALGLLVAHIWFYSRLGYWHGDGSWGPRYLVFVVPFVYLPAAGLLATVAAWRSRLAVVSIGLLAVASFVVQLMPILINFDTYILLSKPHERFFIPADSPIVAHARLWAERASEWWLHVAAPQPGTAVLRDGFSFSEGDRSKGDLLPRWSRADGRVQIYPATNAPLEGRIVVVDHRPWPLPRANFTLLLDGQPLANVQRTDLNGKGADWELRFHLTPEQAHRGAMLDLHSDTWNPTLATQNNPRNEDLGVLVQKMDLRQNNHVIKLVDALPIPPPQNSRRAQWLWYQDTPNHHLFDVWLWYISVSGMPTPLVIALMALIGLPALLCVVKGGRGVAVTFRGKRSVPSAVTAKRVPQVAASPEVVSQ